MRCACFGPRHSPNSYYKCRESDIAAVVSIFNVFSKTRFGPSIEHRGRSRASTSKYLYKVAMHLSSDIKMYLISARIAKFLYKSIYGKVGWLDQLRLGAGGTHSASFGVFDFPEKKISNKTY